MNNKEAIAELNQLYGIVCSSKQQALDVAISALEKQTNTADSVLEEIKEEILDETVERFIDIDKVISILNKHISGKKSEEEREQ